MSATLTRRNFLAFDFGDRRRPGDHWIRVHRVAMACRFEVMLSSDDAGDVGGARAALDEADAMESLLTVFRDTSAVSDPAAYARKKAAVSFLGCTATLTAIPMNGTLVLSSVPIATNVSRRSIEAGTHSDKTQADVLSRPTKPR